MMIKYRVSDVAKDFGRPNKEIAEILGDYLQAPKSNAQALKEPELDVIFEYLTQKNQVESLDQVFAPAAEAAQKRRQESEKRILEKQQKEQPKTQKAAEAPKEQGKVVIEQQPTSATKGPRTPVATRWTFPNTMSGWISWFPSGPRRSTTPPRASRRSSARPTAGAL